MPGKPLREKAAGRLLTAPKSALLPGDGRYMMSTLAVGTDPAFTILKAVSVCPDNPDLGLPAINGSILVFDAHTGLLTALLDANWVTAVRTAALSAVAARRFAQRDARSIGFIGTGVQARSHLAAFMAEYPIAEIRAFGRGRKNLDALIDHARGLGLTASAAESPEDALRDVDIVVTSVTLDYTIEPFLDARWLKPGAFAAITDLGIPWLKEGLDRQAARPRPCPARRLRLSRHRAWGFRRGRSCGRNGPGRGRGPDPATLIADGQSPGHGA